MPHSLLEQAADEYLKLPDLAMAFIALARQGFLAADPEGTIKYASHGLVILSGWHQTELIGKKVEMLLPTNLRERHIEHRAKYSLDPRIRQMNSGIPLKLLHRSGAEIPVTIDLAPYPTVGGMWTLAVIQRHTNA